jgi:uncharacterized protein with HEPN domain
MSRRAADFLNDVRVAVGHIEQFTAGRGLPDYTSDALLHSGVERQFIIIGEALSQLERLDPTVVAPITDYRKAIAFRNILVHGYSTIDDQIVWSVIQNHLPVLRQDVNAVLATLGVP